MKSEAARTVRKRTRFGKSRRQSAPRSSHAEWPLTRDREDPIELIETQNNQRLAWLVPVRRRRMMASPFAFYRAGARIMAADLAATPVSGLVTQICGDAHLSNFGLYASPERKLVFDVNDFDETIEGPWEWDLKRLATSFFIAARHNRLDASTSRQATERVVRIYREAIHEFAEMRTTDIWYAMMDEDDYLGLAGRNRRRRAKKTVAKAKSKDSSQALYRLAEDVGGTYQIKSQPPLVLPLREMTQDQRRLVTEQVLKDAYESYTASVAPHCRVLLRRFHPVDLALKVVGVGSVGTRCWILLLEGRDRNDPLFLQMKEATESALADFLPSCSYDSQGRRVVEGQRLMQTAHDTFLGWTHHPASGHDYYWRQLRDWKGSLDVEDLDAGILQKYARACGWTLARAHARSGDPVAIAGYLGTSHVFDQAVTEFADRYADQNESDYHKFLEKAESGEWEVAENKPTVS